MKHIRTALAVVLACALFPAAEVTGQPEEPRDGDRPQPGQTGAPATAGPLLDAPVDRAYRLGPGDLVHLAVFGEVSMLHALHVSPEGTLVIPEVGVATVLNRTLDEAESRVRALVYRFYRNVDVTLTLSQLRSFKVFVLGDVESPGVRTASSATRVSEVVGVNRVGQRESAGEEGTQRIRRNVLLRRASGDSVLVDLARFTLLGDLSANPTLQEGDALIVPTVEETVTVRGRVAFPGSYEYRSGETLAELLRVVNGGRGFPASAADSLRVSRVAPGGAREILTLPVADAVGAAGAGFVLRSFDAVYVPEVANFGVQYTATVRGQIARPGTYPIRPDTTTVRELVAMAGGFTPRASLLSATLRRRPVAGMRVSGEDMAPDSALSPGERRISRLLAQGESNYVVLDFEQLFAAGESAYDQPIQAGDLLTVPERRNDIAVLGAVVRPGLLAHVPERTVADYVALAGGYTRRADRNDAVVIRASTGTRLSAQEAIWLEPGDRLVIPYREHRTFLDRVQMTQSVLGILSSALLTVASLYAIFR